mmetsp:Transcript_7325/g.13694  ORF Transcript_7325/g.13694 Transcript_7325/m.13694 type:complete len:223 (+) Transcript_7325:55-723(+)|eukprot:CAMPEP_0197523748 /NCGR_PEP_ID=MMETSP1318-20131121/8616_1 /TAXON_ID=552666 /ORGANISM="Partenskyella glossopodia, Strain RCC365" /LENGTH=222 /DNA_ID=CAMNT_0043076539 /DNA_START=56 /DNA_END=724 /DNA_ORIENTATION=-
MVKLVCIAIYRQDGNIREEIKDTKNIVKETAEDKEVRALMICQVNDMSSFSYFTRSKAREFIFFGCRQTCERTPLAERLSVGSGYKDYIAHSMVRYDGLAGVVVTDEEYPKDMAYQLLYLVIRDVDTKLQGKWRKVSKESKVSPPFMETYLKEYQDPQKMDKKGQIQEKIGALRYQLKGNLHELLRRGEDLDDIVGNTEDLSETAKAFYAQSKKHNQCCKSF